MRCSRCMALKIDLGDMTPLGWAPFAWGPEGEDPQHYYVIPEGTNYDDGEVEALAICNIESPVSRWSKQARHLAAAEKRSEE